MPEGKDDSLFIYIVYRTKREVSSIRVYKYVHFLENLLTFDIYQ
jgi:hypothetical protein